MELYTLIYWIYFDTTRNFIFIPFIYTFYTVIHWILFDSTLFYD